MNKYLLKKCGHKYLLLYNIIIISLPNSNTAVP